MKPHTRCISVETLSAQWTGIKQHRSPHDCCVQDAEGVLLVEVKSGGKMDSLQQVRAELVHLGLVRMLISSAAKPGMCFADLTDSNFSGSTGCKSDQSAMSQM